MSRAEEYYTPDTPGNNEGIKITSENLYRSILKQHKKQNKEENKEEIWKLFID
jgi:hypothetical protein